MPVFRTPFSGYSVEFSPFEENKLACATSQHFGIIGNGKQHVLDVSPDGIREMINFDTRDGLYDCTWSEENENHLASSSGDGSVKLWDIRAPHRHPIKSYEEHKSEVYSVDWNLLNKKSFITGSWDESIKLWNPNEDKRSMRTFHEHKYCVYSAQWSPSHADRFASASGDCTLKIWDVNERRAAQTIRAHGHEILTCDWNKYNEFILVSGSVDKSIKMWVSK